MDNIFTLNSGQHILFGFLLTSLQGQANRNFNVEETIKVAELVVELTNVKLYIHSDYCPDVMIMIDPENAYDIFYDWYEENESYLGDFFVIPNL